MIRSAPLDDDAAAGLLVVAGPGLDPWPDLQQALRQAGYVLRVVTQLAEVWPIAESQNPDGIILALSWPDSSSLTVLEQLRRRRSPSAPVLAVSSSSAQEDCLQALAAGAADYIRTPFDPAEVVARLHYPIYNYRLQQRLQRQIQRAATATAPSRLLADLQRVLQRQAQMLRERNAQLLREVREREQAEEALRWEQQKSEQLLLNILPRAVVNQLKQLEGSLAERFDEVTILFADIVNFTPLAAQTSPLELVNWLNQIFSTFDRLAEQLQLEKIKTIGDAYMVVGGLPVPRPDHAEAVMEMAIAMQQAAAQVARQDGLPLQLRIGINTGTVVAGVIGIRKFSYDLWGDAVNIASRMESQGMPGKIQVTEVTYQRLRQRYDFEQVGQVLVKGRGHMTMYQFVERRL